MRGRHFAELTLEAFVDRLASAEPVPGGGSASAVAASLGAALVAMVAALSEGRPKYAAHAALHRRAQRGRATARRPVPRARRRGRGGLRGIRGGSRSSLATPDAEKASRSCGARRPRPESRRRSRWTTVEACLELVATAESLVGRSNVNASSDLNVAALLGDAAARGAAENVLVNLPAIGDDALRRRDDREGHGAARRHRAARGRRSTRAFASGDGSRARSPREALTGAGRGRPPAARRPDRRRDPPGGHRGRRDVPRAARPSAGARRRDRRARRAVDGLPPPDPRGPARRSASTAGSSRSRARRRRSGVTTTIAELNADPTVDGIIVQMPLPPSIRLRAVIDVIDPAKDIDGIHPLNAGLLRLGYDGFLPATAHAAVEILRRSGIEIEGRRAVVVGRSAVVGMPAAFLLVRENATVTVCHSRTRDLAHHVKDAEIVVVAAGHPGPDHRLDAPPRRGRRRRRHQRRRRRARRRRRLRIRAAGRVGHHARARRRRSADERAPARPSRPRRPGPGGRSRPARHRRSPLECPTRTTVSQPVEEFDELPVRPGDRPIRHASTDRRRRPRPRPPRRRDRAVRPDEGQGHARRHPPARGRATRAASTSS